MLIETNKLYFLNQIGGNMKFVFLSLFLFMSFTYADIGTLTGCIKFKNVLGMSKDAQFGPIIDFVSVDSVMIYSTIDTTFSDSNGCYSVRFEDYLLPNLSDIRPKLNREYDYFDPKGITRNKSDEGHLLLQKRAKTPELKTSQHQFLRINISHYEIQVKAKGFVDTVMHIQKSLEYNYLSQDTLYLRKDPESIYSKLDSIQRIVDYTRLQSFLNTGIIGSGKDPFKFDTTGLMVKYGIQVQIEKDSFLLFSVQAKESANQIDLRYALTPNSEDGKNSAVQHMDYFYRISNYDQNYFLEEMNQFTELYKNSFEICSIKKGSACSVVEMNFVLPASKYFIYTQVYGNQKGYPATFSVILYGNKGPCKNSQGFQLVTTQNVDLSLSHAKIQSPDFACSQYLYLK
jgi:hypothetical protein